MLTTNCNLKEKQHRKKYKEGYPLAWSIMYLLHHFVDIIHKMMMVALYPPLPRGWLGLATPAAVKDEPALVHYGMNAVGIHDI